MNLERASYLATLLLVVAGTFALALAESSAVFLACTVLVCALNWHTEFRPRPWRLPHPAATAICMAAFAVTLLLTFRAQTGSILAIVNVRVPLIAKFLLVVQWTLLFRRKTASDFAWICVIALAQLVSTALVLPELQFVVAFFAVVAAGVSALVLLHVRSEIQRCRGSDDAAAPPHAETLAGTRVRWSFMAKACAAAVLLAVPVALLFALLPRAGPGSLGRLAIRGPTPVTGFSNTVELGDIANIQQDDTKVMQVVVEPEPGLDPAAVNLRMRGNALDHYDGRGWAATPYGPWVHIGSGRPLNIYAFTFPRYRRFRRSWPRLRCRVTLNPLDTNVLFAPFVLDRATLGTPTAASRLRLISDLLNCTVRTGARTGQLHYRTESRLVPRVRPAATPPGLWPPRSFLRALSRKPSLPREARVRFLQLPAISPRVRGLARQLTPDDECPTHFDKAVAIERHLSNPDRYRYSLQPSANPRVEPVEDFLFNMREGHCEYFASAMVVMLRSRGIPARLVNGFLHGLWNPFGGYFQFRQRDAHSWVEAYIEPVGWMTFDPTPAGGLEQVRPRPKGILTTLRNFLDNVDRLWITYVIGYSRDMQIRLLAELARPFDRAKFWLARLIYRMLGVAPLTGEIELPQSLTEAVHVLLAIPERLRAFLKRPAWIAGAAVAMLLLIFVAVLLFRRLRQRRPGVRIRFYARLLKVLARLGYERAAGTTPLELANRVVAENGAEFAPARSVTNHFNAVRYGGKHLGTAERTEIEQSLQTLADLISGRRQGTMR